MSTGEACVLEQRFRRADGEYRWHLSRTVAMRDPQGKISLWIGSNTDIHEQWEAANRLRQYAAETSEANHQKSEFLATLAHELRNPLAPIGNALQILQSPDTKGKADAPVIAMLERQVSQMVRLVDDLLDASRISLGRIELRFGHIELTSLVSNAVDVVRPLCKSLGQDLTLQLPEAPIYLKGGARPVLSVSQVGNGPSPLDAGFTVLVTRAELPELRRHPALLCQLVLTFENIDSRQLQTQLRQLLVDNSGSQQIVPAGEHSLIMQGFGSYIASLGKLLQLVDLYSVETSLALPVFDLIPLEFAAAEDVADLLEQLLEAQQEQVRNRPRQAVEGQVSSLGAGQSMESKILVDARTNSLLVMALPEEMPRIKDLVARLDVDVIEPERNFHVYSLQNVKAKELADVLDEFLSGAERLSGQAAGGTGGRAPGAAGGGGDGGGASAR